MIEITLADGRVLGIEAVAPHEAMHLAEGCRNLSGVRSWWRTAEAVAAVRSIGNIPMPFPTHARHIDGLVMRFSRAELQEIGTAARSVTLDEVAAELEFAELTPVEELRLWAVIGEFETIPGWVAPAFISAVVRKIDGESISFPSNHEDVKALVKRLGLAGMTKASIFFMAQKAAEKAAESDKVAAAKN